MKKQELIDGVLSGQSYLVVEFRGSKVEQITYRDAKTQQKASFWKQTHHVELASNPVVVSERIPDGVDPAAIKSPFKKGQTVVLHLTKMESVNGITSAQGVLLPLE